MENLRNNIAVTIVGSLIIGIFLGYLVSQNVGAQAKNEYSSSNAVSNSDGGNLRLNLNSLLKEHAVLGATTLTALYKGEDTSQLMKLMMDNQAQIVALVNQAYGSEKGNTFNELWTQHMTEYENYTKAEKNGDTETMDKSKQNLQDISSKLGSLLARKNLQASTINTLFTEHVNGTLAIVDAVAREDSASRANGMKLGYDQAGKLADTLSEAILKDN